MKEIDLKFTEKQIDVLYKLITFIYIYPSIYPNFMKYFEFEERKELEKLTKLIIPHYINSDNLKDLGKKLERLKVNKNESIYQKLQ